MKKYLIVPLICAISMNVFSEEYKILFNKTAKPFIVADVVDAPPAEPTGSMHQNGVTVVCSGMADGVEFDLNGNTYRVVYNKADAVAYATSACTSNITSMGGFFSNTSFNEDISHWDTSNVKNMGNMFQQTSAFNQDISSWDTSKVSHMGLMFYLAVSFNQNINNWDVSNVKNMSSMFQQTSSYNQPINSWDTSKVEYMNHMFYLASSFNQPLNQLNTSSVIDMRSMFQQSPIFNQPICNWDISNVAQFADFRFSSALSSSNAPKFSGSGFGGNCP